MGDSLPTLRERLRQQDPELAADLDLQWRIANSEWLPAVSPLLDSSNSGPHLANIERHLDATLAILHQQKPSASVLDMAPIEIYMMLAAVLFHDLGRAKLPPGSKEDHGEATRELLRASYQNLGVRNREVALSLGRICASHTAEPKSRQTKEHDLKLGDVALDPHGQVRERMIAALLTLGDHMDSAQTRVVPDYLRDRGKDPVGAFRNVIRGVVADPASRCIRTVLVAKDDNVGTTGAPPDTGAAADDESQFILNKDAEDLVDWRDQPATAEGERDHNTLIAELLNPPPKRRSRAKIKPAVTEKDVKLTRGAISESDFGKAWEERLNGVFGELRGEGAFEVAEQLIARKILYEPPDGDWPRKLLVAVVLGDLRSNRIALRSIREQLAAVGLPLATWLVDHQERLYTPDCCETYEPVLHRDYLSDVADGMWEFSTRVFGASEFTYHELASQLGERNVARVRTAARRIAIATTRHSEDYDYEDPEHLVAMNPKLPWPSPIWIGDETWKWRVRRDRDSRGPRFGTVARVEELIRRLAEPDDSPATEGVA